MTAGRVAIVTGAGGGLGSAIAASFARQGLRLVLQDRHEQELERIGQELAADDVRLVAGDVRDESHVGTVVSTALDEFGGLDVLVNNAGIMSTAPLLELTTAEWDDVLDTNLKGYFLFARAAARVMAGQGSGRIVNVASTRQVQAIYGGSAYCASKAGVAMLTRTMALELAPFGIRVNSVAPGTIRTGLNRHYLDDPATKAERIARIPAGRLGTPDDVVAAVDLLISDAADFIVGACLTIDGGQTLW